MAREKVRRNLELKAEAGGWAHQHSQSELHGSGHQLNQQQQSIDVDMLMDDPLVIASGEQLQVNMNNTGEWTAFR